LHSTIAKPKISSSDKKGQLELKSPSKFVVEGENGENVDQVNKLQEFWSTCGEAYITVIFIICVINVLTNHVYVGWIWL